MPLIEKRASAVWKAIEGDDAELIENEPDFAKMKLRLAKRTCDLTGWPYSRPRYIMHDLLDVPVVTLKGSQQAKQTNKKRC
jgi:hypothetical protein